MKQKITLVFILLIAWASFSEEPDIIEDEKSMKSIAELQKLQRQEFHKELKKIMIYSRRNGSLYKDPIGRYYTNGRYKFKLDNQDVSPTFSHIEYRIGDSAYEAYAYPIAFTEQKRYRLIYRGIDKLGNKENEHIYNIIVDKTAPTIQYNLEGLSYINDGRTYYKPGVKLILTANDTSSGIFKILTSIKDRSRKVGEQKFTHLGYLPYEDNQKEFSKHGLESVLVRAMDKVYNLSRKKEIIFFIDSRGPNYVSARMSPEIRQINGKPYCRKKSVAYINAEDEDSGLYNIQFRFSEKEAWKDYRGNIPIRTQKELNLYYRAIDNLGNYSSAKKLHCFMDITPPDSKIHKNQ